MSPMTVETSLPGAPAIGRWSSLLLLFLTVLGLYGRTLFFDFTYLDERSLVLDRQAYLAQPSTLWKAFGDPYLKGSPYYRPVITASFALDALWSGVKPFGYHLSNLLIHLAACLLVLAVLRGLCCGEGPSLLGALVFAVHPAAVEGATWIPGRNDMLFAVFALGAWLALIKEQERSSRIRRSLHLACFLGALFSKEAAVCLPLLFLAQLRLGGEGTRTVWRPWAWLGWGCSVALFAAVRVGVMGATSGFLADGVLTAFRRLPMLVAGLGKLFVPLYYEVIATPSDVRLWTGFVAAAVILAAFAALGGGRRGRILLLALAAMLLPMAANLPGADKLVLESRLYPSVAGAALFLAEWLRPVRLARPAAVALAAAAVLALAGRSFLYQGDFANVAVFTEAAVRQSPHSALAHLQRGLFLEYARQDPAAGRAAYRRALEANPAEPMAHNNLGFSLMNAGQWAEAEGHFRSELALNPVNAKARYNLGVTLFALNRREEAQAEWLRLLRQEPDDLAAMAALVRSYSSAGRPELADRWRRELERRGIRLE